MAFRVHHTAGINDNFLPKPVTDLLYTLQNSCSIPSRITQNIDVFLPEMKPLLQELSSFTGTTFDMNPSNPLELKFAGIVEDALLHSYNILKAIEYDLILGELTPKTSFWYSFLQLVFGTPVLRNCSYCLSRRSGGGYFPYRTATALVVVELDYEPGSSEERPDSIMMSSDSGESSPDSDLHGDPAFINLHIVETPGNFYNRSLSLFCLDIEENLFDLMESALHQRRAWGIFQPIAGIKLDELGLSATVIIAWFDKDHNALVPVSHFLSFPKRFRLDNPADTLSLLRFLISLIPDMQIVNQEAVSAWPLIRERGSAGPTWRDDIVDDEKRFDSIRRWSATVDDHDSALPVSSASDADQQTIYQESKSRTTRSYNITIESSMQPHSNRRAVAVPVLRSSDGQQAKSWMMGYLQDRLVVEVARAPEEKRTWEIYTHYDHIAQVLWISHWTLDFFSQLSETVTETARVLVIPGEGDVNGIEIYRTELKKTHLLGCFSKLWNGIQREVASGKIKVIQSSSISMDLSNSMFDFLGRRLGYVLRASDDVLAAYMERPDAFEAHGECRGAWDRILCHMLRDDAEPGMIRPYLEKMLVLSRNPLEGVSTKSEYDNYFAVYRDFAKYCYEFSMDELTRALSYEDTMDGRVRSRTGYEAVQLAEDYRDLIRKWKKTRFTETLNEWRIRTETEPVRLICDAIGVVPVQLAGDLDPEVLKAFSLLDISQNKTTTPRQATEVTGRYLDGQAHYEGSETRSQTHMEIIEEMRQRFKDVLDTDRREILLPLLLFEYHEDVTRRYQFQEWNQLKSHMTSSIIFLREIGIVDFPIYGLCGEGLSGYLFLGVYSSKDKKIYIMDMDPITFDLSSYVEVYKVCLFLRRLVLERAPKLRAEFAKVREALETRLRVDGKAACRWRRDPYEPQAGETTAEDNSDMDVSSS